MTIEVVKPGAMSLLQDLGRYGYQHFGVVVGGAMDERSHRVANALVGNQEDEATLEMTLLGPSLLFHTAQVIAISGADLSARIGDMPVPLERALLVRAGARLEFGRRVDGLRAYLAVRGGIPVAPVMDSRSTYVRGGLGGMHGRPLKKGDILPVGAAEPPCPASSVRLLEEFGFVEMLRNPVTVPRLPASPTGCIRVIQGQHWDLFTEESQEAFLHDEFHVSPVSDRMGCRLEGNSLSRRHTAEMASEGVAFGTIQVPPDGLPIILMADRQTAGGYPKIGNVASVDLPRLAQVVPGQVVRFELIGVQEAQRLYLAREQLLQGLRAQIQEAEDSEVPTA